MNIIMLGAAGFIGTNLVIELARRDHNITVVSKELKHCKHILNMNFPNVKCIRSDLSVDTDYRSLVKNQDVVYHLLSSTVPTTSNQHISQEIINNVVLSSNLLDACVSTDVKKVIFFSSGGTVYGKEVGCPLKEDTPTKPISSYGVQKITIEKLIYLYHYMYGIDYRIIRLGNPYGPFQRPNGVLGAVTMFTYKALCGEPIVVYGDGSVIRDFIYIDDAIRGVLNISENNCKHKTYNLGSGYGTSINDVLNCIRETLNINVSVEYTGGRKVDVPVNYLDISRYEETFGKLNPIPLSEGIRKTASFLIKEYNLAKYYYCLF